MQGLLIKKVSNPALDIYEKKEFVYNGNTLRYRILYPVNYDKNKKYPLLLFLHGAGERGNDNEKQLIHGARRLRAGRVADHPRRHASDSDVVRHRFENH